MHNILLAGLPWSTVAPLQRVQNAAARLVLGLSPRHHVSPALLELHWLSVIYRIQFKLGLLMYTGTRHNVQSPMYISDALTPISRVPFRGRLRSADTTDYLVPRRRSKFGERAFCVSGHLVWNSLPESLRTVDSITTFRRRLKTHFLTFTYHDFTFTVLVFSIIVDTCYCRAGPGCCIGLALNICNVM